VRLLVFVAALGFLAAGFAAWNGWLDLNNYSILITIVGGVASILGLIGLLSQRLTAQDMRRVGADLTKDVGEALKQLQEYEQRASVDREEINRLARERAEIELLVRQASLKAFMEERLRYISLEVERRISGDATLIHMLDDYATARAQVSELDGQIENSERADLVREILSGIHVQRADQVRPLYLKFAGMEVDISPLILASRNLAQLTQEAISRMIR
jgi:vacuolar-type H+-ATPase subunit I/STV1